MTLPLAQFLTVWAFLGLNIASPGPNVLNTIASAMGSGRRVGMGSALAVGFGVALWCLGMSLGMAAVFRAYPAAQTLLTAGAAGLLLWFAARYLRAAWAGYHGQRSVPGGATGLGFAVAFRRSLLVNVLNPKALTSWLAILTFFPVARAQSSDIALLCAGASAIAVALHALYALAFSTPAAARLYLRAGWVISAVAGVFFASFALRLFAEVLRQRL
jgi:threonine/homoserine/homoserine lactone efflux protein